MMTDPHTEALAAVMAAVDRCFHHYSGSFSSRDEWESWAKDAQAAVRRAVREYAAAELEDVAHVMGGNHCAIIHARIAELRQEE